MALMVLMSTKLLDKHSRSDSHAVDNGGWQDGTKTHEACTEGRVEGPRIAPEALEASYRTSVSARLCRTSSI